MLTGYSMNLLFCILSIETRWHIDYRVNFENKISEHARRHSDVSVFFSNIMFFSGKVVLNNVTCIYKVSTYNWKT